MDTAGITKQTQLIIEAFNDVEPINSLELILDGQSDEVNETVACLDSIVEQGLDTDIRGVRVDIPFWTGNDFHAVLDWFQCEIVKLRASAAAFDA